MKRNQFFAALAGLIGLRSIASAQSGSGVYLIEVWIPGRSRPRYLRIGPGLTVTSAGELTVTQPQPPPAPPARIRHVKLTATAAGAYPIPADAIPESIELDANGIQQHAPEHYTITAAPAAAIVPAETWQLSDGTPYDVYISYDRRP